MFRIMIISLVAVIGLAGCGDDASQKVSHEKNTATNIKPVTVKNETNTQDVKKIDGQAVALQSQTLEASQTVAQSLAKDEKDSSAVAKVNPCSAKMAVVKVNPCSAKRSAVDAPTSSAMPASVKEKASSVVAKGNPCREKIAKVKVNPCSAKKIAVAGATDSAMAASVVVNIKPFNAKKCKACHSVTKKKAGPAWKDVVAAYGSADALAAVFKSGFNVADRKVITANSKWKSKAGMMTAQYKKLIKSNPDGAAKALFDAVKAGKI